MLRSHGLISLFQFHNGTIKTKCPVQKLSKYTKFQFHNGTIKTSDMRFAATDLFCFNSITVQLRHTFSIALHPPNSRFNSITVQLRPCKITNRIEQDTFQFHNGTIKTIVFALTQAGVFLFQFHNGTIKTFSFSCFDCEYFVSIP